MHSKKDRQISVRLEEDDAVRVHALAEHFNL